MVLVLICAYFTLFFSPNTDNDFSDEAHFEVLRDSLQQIDLIHRLIEINAVNLKHVSRARDIIPAFHDGKIACLVGAEGLHQIANSASVLRSYYRLGVRYVTLAHSENNMYADSAVSKDLRIEMFFFSFRVTMLKGIDRPRTQANSTVDYQMRVEQWFKK